MVTIQTADNALKSFYLDAVAEALNFKTNPLLAKIQRTSADVVGKDVRKMMKVGINGGIGAGSETGNLPNASQGEYLQFVTPLKNLYGTIEISDKAIRASANNEGAFVNLLNDEMQSLIKSSTFNFGRMLFGDGTGKLATIEEIDEGVMYLDNVNGIVEGMRVDLYTPLKQEVDGAKNLRVVEVDRNMNSITLENATFTEDEVPAGSGVFLQSSMGYEITGLGALFSKDATLYGVDKQKSVMKPYSKDNVGAISELVIQKAMDKIEETSGSKINFIVCSWGVRRALVQYFRENNLALPTMEVDGFTALDFHGVPIVADRFCPEKTMYLLNTDDFKLHQLCDWQWLEGEDGKILKQVPGKPLYTATLVKYAELMCERPCGQGRLVDITEV